MMTQWAEMGRCTGCKGDGELDPEASTLDGREKGGLVVVMVFRSFLACMPNEELGSCNLRMAALALWVTFEKVV